MNEAVQTVFKHIDALIKIGRFSDALVALKHVKIKNLSREEKVEYCSYLRRIGRSREAVKILFSTVYPKARSAEKASDLEKIEYASNLVRLGILSEAERIFNSIVVEKNPIVLVRLGFLSISRWDYKKANEFFLRYLNAKNYDEYNKLIAQVNLLQGYVNLEELDPAFELYQQIVSTPGTHNYKLLLAATYEFGAEMYRLKEDFKLGLQLINVAKELVQDQETLDYFLLEKQEWLLNSDLNFCDAFEKQYLLLKKRAVHFKHYESMRDLDFHFARYKQNEKQLSYIYWKTSSAFYKEKIFKICLKNNLSLNSRRYSPKKSAGPEFDIGSLCFLNAEIEFKPNQAVARLFAYLLSEGYRPIKTIDIFNAVYPSEIYIPDFSEVKIYQLIKRFKHFLKTAQLPIELVSKDNQYALSFHGAFTLLRKDTKMSSDFLRIKKKFNHQSFRVLDVMNIFDCSWRTAMRKIRLLKKEKNISVTGKTKRACYRVVKLKTPIV